MRFLGRAGHLILNVTWPQWSVRGDLIDRRAVVVKLQFAAAGLLEIEQLQLAAGGFQVDGLARQARRDTDAAQAIEAVAIAGEQAVGTPAAGLTALQIHPPIAFVGSAGERIAAATIAELRLQQR